MTNIVIFFLFLKYLNANYLVPFDPFILEVYTEGNKYVGVIVLNEILKRQ